MKFVRVALVFFSFLFVLCIQAQMKKMALSEPIKKEVRLPEVIKRAEPHPLVEPEIRGVPVPENVKEFVKTPSEPKPITVPTLEEKKGDLYERFGEARNITREKAFVNLIKSLETKEKALFSFLDIPIIGDIPLPKKIKNFFGKLKMSFPSVSLNARGGFSISGTVKIGEKFTRSRVAVDKDVATGRTLYSVTVELPTGWKFSDTFPKIKGFDPGVLDLIEFKRAWVVLSSARYYDPFLNRDIRMGLNFFAETKIKGPFFRLLNKLSRGALGRFVVDMHGVIGLNPKLVGTLLQIDLPVGLKLTKWLETTKASLLIGVEEDIGGVAQPTVGIRGGIKLFALPKKKPVVMMFTGKYVYPETIELYGEMKRWLNNFPVPYMSVGDVRIGTITDFGVTIVTEGLALISGINLAAGIGILDSRLHLAVKDSFDSTTVIKDMTFILTGDLHLKDLVGFWFRYAQGIAYLFKKDLKFAKKIMSKIPAVDLEKITVAFVPRETIEEQKRTEITVGSIKLFGVEGSGSLYAYRDGIGGRLFLPEIVIGPRDNPLFYATGPGLGKDRRGMLVKVVLSPLEQVLYSDVIWGGSLFGGIRARGRVDISVTGLELIAEFKLGGLLDTELTVRADLLRDTPGLENFVARVRLQQEGQIKLAFLLKKAARELLGEVQEKLDRLRKKQLEKLEEKLVRREERIQSDIDYLKQTIQEKIQQCDKRFTGLKIGMRLVCYAWAGVPFDSIRLLRKFIHRDIGLDVRMTGGVVSVEMVTGIPKLITRPVGKLMRYLANLIYNVIHIRTFEAEASFKRLKEGKPFILKEFEAMMMGQNVSIKNIGFDLKNVKLFLIKLFDRLGLRFKDDEE